MTHPSPPQHRNGADMNNTDQRWDPLSGTRAPEDPPLDVLLCGTVFFDIIFTGLERQPAPGEEIWSKGLGSCPGGIANLATAAARLGLRTGLVAGFGDDAYADWMWDTLSEQEGIDLSASPRIKDFHSSLTVSMAYGDDRSMVTHGHPLPVSLSKWVRQAKAARSAVIDLSGESSWWSPLVDQGLMIFADVGFDESERWDISVLAPLQYCHAFTPNAVEAMRYTRTDAPGEALRKLADLVPLAVVTDGVRGSYAIDQTTGEQAYCPAVVVAAMDPTGAGDVFAASLLLGTLAKWPLEHRLRFSSLCSALAVQQFGGSLAAPGWGDIADWWRCLKHRADSGDLKADYERRSYDFLDEVIPKHRVHGVRRAQGTFATASDAGIH